MATRDDVGMAHDIDEAIAGIDNYLGGRSFKGTGGPKRLIEKVTRLMVSATAKIGHKNRYGRDRALKRISKGFCALTLARASSGDARKTHFYDATVQFHAATLALDLPDVKGV